MGHKVYIIPILLVGVVVGLVARSNDKGTLPHTTEAHITRGDDDGKLLVLRRAIAAEELVGVVLSVALRERAQRRHARLLSSRRGRRS